MQNTNCQTSVNYDLVYIIKPSDTNEDLRFSLRSIEKFCKYRKIFIVGYKPIWIKNINYIPTIQIKDRWENSLLNIYTACSSPDISNDFVLMNDDFIAIKPIIDIQNSINVCLGPLTEAVNRYKHGQTTWQLTFKDTLNILLKNNIQNPINLETHLPFIINKEKYLSLLASFPDVCNSQCFKVHKRTIYYNIMKDAPAPCREIEDVKIKYTFDLSERWLKEDWISVFDNVIGNEKKFPKLNNYLQRLFPQKSNFEI